MTYDGYFKLGGTELINVARTLDYANKLAPAFGLTSRKPCTGLATTLGRDIQPGPDARGDVLEVRTNYQQNPRYAAGSVTGFGQWAYGGGSGSTIASTSVSTIATRTNLATNPNPTDASGTAGWNFQAGTGEATTLTYVTGATDGPTPEITNYLRRTVTTAKTAGTSGFFYREPAGAAIAGAAGVKRRLAVWVRFTPEATMSGSLSLRSGLTNVGLASLTETIPANAWRLLTAEVTSTATFDGAQLFAAISSTLPVGGFYDVAVAHVEDATTWQGTLFWGAQPATVAPGDLRLTQGWAGAAGASASVQRYGNAPEATLGDAPTFARVIFTAPASNLAYGWRATTATYWAPVTGVPGDKITIRVRQRWIGMAAPRPSRVAVQLYRADGTAIAADVAYSNTVSTVSAEVVDFCATVTATEAFTAAGYTMQQTSGAAPEGASVVDFGAISVEKNAPTPYMFFDGGTVDTLEYDYAWTGATNASASTRTTYDIVPTVIDRSYVDPATDGAPWYDPARSATADFLGMYPLGVAGIDDSTRSAEMTDLVGDGAVAGRTRRDAREMRFETLMLSKSEEGLDAGLSWLESALDSFRCDGSASDCTPGSLEFFSSCPSPQEVSPANQVALWDGTNPAAESARWTGSFGATFTSTGTLNFATSGPGGSVSRELTGLVSGQWYRMELVSSGDGRISATVAGQTVRLPRTAIEMGNTPRAFYMEFLARKTTETLTLTFTAPAVYATTPIVLASYRIDRTRGNSIKAQTLFEANTGESRGGEPYGLIRLATLAPLPPTVDDDLATPMTPNTWTRWQGNITSLMRMQWRPTGMGSWSAGIETRLLEFPLPALPAGNYRTSVWLWGDSTFASIPNPEYVARMRSGGTNITGSSALVTLPRSDSGSPATRLDIDFDISEVEATRSISVVIGMRNPLGNVSVPATDRFILVPLAITVLDMDALTDIPAPDTTLKYHRRMNRVTAIDGPRVLDRYRTSCGWAARVSFGLAAGDPRKYKLGRSIGTFPFIHGPSGQTSRCRNGLPYFYNLGTNPTFQTNTAGWTLGPTFSWMASTAPTWTNSNIGNGSIGTSSFSSANTTTWARHTYSITTSGWYHVLAVLRATTGIQSFVFSVGTDVSNPANLVPETPFTATAAETTGQFFGDFYVDVVGEGVISQSITVTMRYTGTPIGSATVNFDAVVMGVGRYNRNEGYFDGTYAQTGKEPVLEPRSQGWDGAAHASSSWLIPQARSPLPCVAFPRAPLAPIIADACVPVGARTGADYEIQVAPGAVSSFGKVVPRVTIEAPDDLSSTPWNVRVVSYVRMRWYRNPLGLPVAELDPCSFEFEQTMTMVPLDATTIIDGETRSAHAVSYPGSAVEFDMDMTARVFGPDFQGTSWPELSCGEQYTVLVSTSSNTLGAGGTAPGRTPSARMSLGIELVPVS